MSDPPTHRPAVDPATREYRYFRNAVERHWDPYAIDLDVDRERVAELDSLGFDHLRRMIALFGGGEQAVTEDLSPLAIVVDDVNDQMFITTQLYEEARHTDFFDRYWREVINPAEDLRGEERSSPTEERWFCPGYDELFQRNADAMYRLLDEDTDATRARAYCHYHLVIEGIMAQTGYYAMQTDFGGELPELPRLPGLDEGFSNLRRDEGRHVGFGMAKLKELVETETVAPQFLHDTVNELIPVTQDLIMQAIHADEPGLDPTDLVEYSAEQHTRRMEQITDAGTNLPDVEELTRLPGD